MASSIDALLRAAEQTLSQVGVAHALIGGCARNVYAPPRATRDVDWAVQASAEQYQRLSQTLRDQGYDRVTETRASAGEPTPDVALFSDASGGRIDLLIAHTDFEEQAIARAATIQLSIGPIRVVRVEDLLIYKALAGRPRDLVDIEEIVRFQRTAGQAIDWSYVETECSKWSAWDLVIGPKTRGENP